MEEYSKNLGTLIERIEIMDWLSKFVVFIRIPKSQQNANSQSVHEYVVLLEKLGRRPLFK
jgi:hypothetical protein